MMIAKRRLFAIAFAVIALRANELPAAISYSISGTWPTTASRDAYDAGMDAAVAAMNSYGDFGTRNINVAYVGGVGTADSGYQSQIRVGGAYSWPLPRRVLQHELDHNFGSGTTSAWENKFDGNGIWTGARVTQLIKQFDGDGAVLRKSGAHFYPYGLNQDFELTDIDNAIGAETVYMRNTALRYAMRQDTGLGPAANPWSATNVTLNASDALGTSAFNNWGVWSDNYFAHAGAAYSSGDFLLRTPLNTYGGVTPDFTFAGDSLSINNANGISGGLLFKGVGSTGVLTINNLNLNGGYVRHASGAADLFQLAGSVNLTGSPTIDAAQGPISILAPISGGGSLTKLGAYALTLNGANSYSGATNINAGSLVLNIGGLPNTASVNIANGATLTVQGSITTGGVLTSAGTVSLANDALNTLSVGGGLNLNNALLNLELGAANADRISANGVASGAGNTVRFSTVSGQSITPGTPYTLMTAAGGLDAANFSLGALPASLGFYQFSLATPTPTALELTAIGQPAPSVAYWTGKASASSGDANNWGNNPSSRTLSNWSTDASGLIDALQLPSTVTSVIFTAANAVGSGSTLSTRLDADYSVHNLSFNVAAASGITTTTLDIIGNALSLGSGGLTLSATSNSSATISGAGSIVVSGNQSWANNNNSRSLSVGAGISASAGATALTIGGTGAGGVTLGGALGDGGGTLSMVFNQAGTTTLSGLNTYTGSTTVSSGIVQISSSGQIVSNSTIASGATLRLIGGTNAIGDANSVTVQSGGTFDLRGSSSGAVKTETIASLNGAGAVTRGNAGLSTLTVSSGVFSGRIENGSGQLALVKTGSSALALSGASNFSGGAVLSAGTLAIGSNSALGTGTVEFAGAALQSTDATARTVANPITFSTNTTFAGTGNLLFTGAVNAGSLTKTFTVDNSRTEFSGVISGSGLRIKGGAGTLVLSGVNTYTGGTTLNAGTLNIGNLGALGTTGTITLAGGTFDNTSGAAGTLSGTHPQTWSGSFNFTGTNSLNLGVGAVTLTASPTIGVNNNTLTVGGAIGGAFGLTVRGGGVLGLAGASTFAGAVSVNGGGTLRVSSLNSVVGGTATSNLGAPTTVANGTISLTGANGNGTLVYVGSGETTDRVVNLGAGTAPNLVGTLDQSGSGLLRFTSALTATGAQPHILSLKGSTAGTGELAGAIVDNSSVNRTSLVKEGTGAWTLSGANTYTGPTTVSAGTLRVNSTTGTGLTTVASGATLSGSGTIAGGLAALGTVAPGTAAGTLAVVGAATLSSTATLSMELGGLLTSQYDRLNVSGQLSAGGALNIVLIDGFSPRAGDSFDLLNWGTRSGTFANLVLPGLRIGLGWNTSELYTTGVLSVANVGIPGDYNNDRVVDAADFTLYRDALNTSTNLPNDTTPGSVTTADFAVWQTNFGVGLVNGIAIPEAVPIAQLLIACIALLPGVRLRARRVRTAD